ncbi:flagellar basal body L-ring protein FlgH [Desulfolithobacter sp.]
MKFFLPYLCIALFIAGCGGREPQIVRAPEPLEPMVTQPPRPQSPGSLWPGEREGLYADMKARRVGDIVTITIKEEASASKEASTESGRDTTMTAGIPALFGLEKSIMAKNQKVDMTSLLDATFSNQFKGSGKTMRKEDLVATLTTQVIKVYPNGTMKIRGGKSIIVNNEEQIIYLTGIVRPEDITADNTIDSSQILNAQIVYTGKGALSDKQKPGWLMRIVDNVWPF